MLRDGTRMKLSFIGGGKMAESIVHGVLAGNLANPGDISVGEPVAERRSFLKGEFGFRRLPTTSRPQSDRIWWSLR